jgi:hypothetical protein
MSSALLFDDTPDRGVSFVVSSALFLMIMGILSLTIITATGGYVDSAQDTAIRGEGEQTVDSLIGTLQAIDRAARQPETTAIRQTVGVPERLAGSKFAIHLNSSSSSSPSSSGDIATIRISVVGSDITIERHVVTAHNIESARVSGSVRSVSIVQTDSGNLTIR